MQSEGPELERTIEEEGQMSMPPIFRGSIQKKKHQKLLPMSKIM